MIILFSLILISYIILVAAFRRGWKSLCEDVTSGSELPFLSVVICARNESGNLPGLLHSLDMQAYRGFEVIIADDHSSDATYSLCRDWAAERPYVTVFHTDREGKKNALNEAVLRCSGEYILQTDADCVLPPKWTEAVADKAVKDKCDVIICPVMMEGEGIFGEIQSLEFLSLAASGAGAAGLGRPVMCNGAGLAYRRRMREEMSGRLKEDLASGDDMFLMLEAKHDGRRISFLKRSDAIVRTRACDSLHAFVRQRMRWSSKSLHYNDADVAVTALTVLGASMLPPLCLVSGCYGLAAAAVAVKSLTDYFFLKETAPFFGLDRSLRLIPLVEAAYPVYVAVCGVAGLFSNRKKW